MIRVSYLIKITKNHQYLFKAINKRSSSSSLKDLLKKIEQRNATTAQKTSVTNPFSYVKPTSSSTNSPPVESVAATETTKAKSNVLNTTFSSLLSSKSKDNSTSKQQTKNTFDFKTLKQNNTSSTAKTNETASIPEKGSIREALRSADELKKLELGRRRAHVPHKSPEISEAFDEEESRIANKGEIRGSPSDIRKQVLRSVANQVDPDDDVDDDGDYDDDDGVVNMSVRLGGAGAVSIGVEEQTSGEKRNARKKDHLRRTRQAFQNKTGSTNSVSESGRRKRSKPQKNRRERESDVDLDEDDFGSPEEQADRRDAVNLMQNAMKRSSKKKKKRVRPVFDMNMLDMEEVSDTAVNKTQTFTISELKALAEAKLQGQNTYITSQMGVNEDRANTNAGKPQPVPTKAPASTTTVIKSVLIPSDGLLLRELAGRMSMRLQTLREKLALMGESIDPQTEGNTKIDPDVVELIVLELGFSATRLKLLADKVEKFRDDRPRISRAPVVTIMGHVDHGKTTLLDYLRSANVAADEAGGITQKLSAFSVELKRTVNTSPVATENSPLGNSRVVFLDTPGHAAFSTMRQSGASTTDVAVLVVAIDDGVRPQTIEALKAAKAASCTIIVALNKIDKIPRSDRAAARGKVLSRLSEHGLVAEEFGGDAMVVEISARSGEGVDMLIETLALQTDVLDLTAPVSGLAEATVLDACFEKGRGVVANLIVRSGTLNVGDIVVAGPAFGKVKGMYSDGGSMLKKAGPSTPLVLTGLRGMPEPGQRLQVVDSEQRAKQITDRRIRVLELRKVHKRSEAAQLVSDSEEASLSNVKVLLKADSPSTADALEKVVSDLARRSKEVTVEVVGASVGDITQSDLEVLGSIKDAETCVLAFNVGVADSSTRNMAKELNIRISRNTVCY